MTAYDIPMSSRKCLNCVHLDQPLSDIAGIRIGGCRERIGNDGIFDIKTFHCSQWYLKPIENEEY